MAYRKRMTGTDSDFLDELFDQAITYMKSKHWKEIYNKNGLTMSR